MINWNAVLFDRIRGFLLFYLPLPLLFKALAGLWAGHATSALVNAGCYALFLAAALIARRGFTAEKAYLARPFAHRRPRPLKRIAAGLVGIATALTALLAVGHPIAIALVFGIAATAGFVLAYGLDPKARTIPVGDHGVSGDELQTALAEAYGRLDRIDAARQGIRSTEFQQRLASIVGWTRKILQEIEEDPRDLRRARRFLNIYLGGIETVTNQYARTHADARTTELEQRYRTLLVDMETVCVEQHEKLRQNDHLDLDVRIEVLSERLRREGVL